MAHFAKVVENIVCEIIIVDNKNCGDVDFPDSEVIGQKFIAGLGLSGEYLQTSYNNNFRGIYAGIGFMYDRDMDVFIVPPLPEETQ